MSAYSFVLAAVPVLLTLLGMVWKLAEHVGIFRRCVASYEGGTMTVTQGTAEIVQSGASISGTTLAFVANGDKVEVQVSPANAITIDWTVHRTDTLRLE